MATPTPNSSTSPPSTGASWRSAWGQRLSWLISALSGTLEIEAETEMMRQENAQMRKETEQMKSENARLAELESKIDGLFSKYNINSPPPKTPEQP
jgi:Tfp pilus assembly protein PilN